ncbi:hypothetical protein PAXRUDRAFT_158258, partial [Paxillus rubicundulus Ve08.2h10]
PCSVITLENLFSAFSSPTAGLLMHWQYSGSNLKLAAELNCLGSFIQDPQFEPALEYSFNHNCEQKLTKKYLCADHGWKISSIPVLLPHEWTKFQSGECNPSVPVLMVDGVHHHDITDIIISTFQDKISSTYHMTPFEEYWKPDPGDSDPIRVFGEAYTSPQYLDTYQQVNSLPREDGDDLGHVVVPLMLWSDATHLTNFGDASLWPLYMFFGNESKYTCRKLTAAACHHMAYIPTVCHP